VALRRGTREATLAIAVAAAVLLAMAPFANTAFLRNLETGTLDLRFRLRGVESPGPEVAVVLVDDRSLAAYGRWPFSRRLFARAIDALDRAGAKVIVFDLLFAEPEQPIPVDLRDAARDMATALPPDGDHRLRAALDRLAADDPDDELARAIRAAGRVLLPIAFSFHGSAGAAPDYLSDAAFAQFEKSPLVPVFPVTPVAVLPPIERLATSAAGLGHVSWLADLDGAPRYDPVALPFEGDYLPSMALRAAADYLGVPWAEVGLALGESVHIGATVVPTDPAMRLLINYRGPRGTIPTTSFVDLVDGRATEGMRGKIVLLGASFLGASDSFASPFGSTPIPGTERMANVVDTILHRDFITERPPLWTQLSLVLVLLLAAATGAAMALLPTQLAALAAAATIAAWLGGVQLAFLHGMWLPVVSPLAALAAALLSVVLFRYWFVEREGRRVRSAFRQYMAPAMVELLAAHPERLRLGGETRTMTMLFCDVRGFTAISEQFKANPAGLTQLINRFLTPMTDIIMARRGTIDKYMGDCIMAFWNAPLDDAEHADHACDSALAMIEALRGLNAELADEAARERREHRPLEIGIGLNTGECVVGNMGSEQRFDYSVLGDAVNLASRLEGQSKTYGVGIVIGEATRAAAASWAALELDLIVVKGKREAVRIYGLLGPAEMADTAEFGALAERHEAMLTAYRRQDWDEASAALSECRRPGASLARLYDLYEERIAYCRANPPGDDWDGVFVATSK
jgi:adenylate cyclase